jgi:hypothetical protein
MNPTYWLNLFSYKTWNEFLKAGGKVTGFREGRWTVVQRIRPGDLMLCYLTGVSRWIGLLEVTGPAFRDEKKRIWEEAVFSARLPVKLIITLEPETAVPITELKDRLSIFNDLPNPHAWTGRLRGSPAKWKAADGRAIVEALEAAKRDPVPRAFDPAKLARRAPILQSSTGDSVTVPDSQDEVPETGNHAEQERDATAHTEIQWLLAKLGNDIGLDVWVARNDRNRTYSGKGFTGLSRLIHTLPVQFDAATNRTVELIDVLWLDGNSIKAAFEIESTTSIYSGLLRMADLISMQPNLTNPLYLVAPASRREKVKTEINRPTFSKLKPPLTEVCRYISFDDLRQNVAKAAPFIRHLSPHFLEEFAEDCDLTVD